MDISHLSPGMVVKANRVGRWGLSTQDPAPEEVFELVSNKFGELIKDQSGGNFLLAYGVVKKYDRLDQLPLKNQVKRDLVKELQHSFVFVMIDEIFKVE